MYKNLDLESWNRFEQYKFFKKYDNPFFNICSSIDVTELLQQSKKLQLSFSSCLLFASIDTANNIESFKYRLKDDGVVIYDSIYAGSTILNDDNSFSFSYFDYNPDFKTFYKNARKHIQDHKAGKITFDGRNNDLDIIHYSIIPWINFTSFSHPRNYKTNDSIPKIVFGQYYEIDGRKRLPLSIEVHHALMDGYHLGLYLAKLQNMLNKASFIC
jgi:chloramphenicol O-acetyltransferase type A